MSNLHRCVGISSIVLALYCTDCKLFQSACDSALPVIAKTQALSNDAATALEQAQNAVSQLNIPASRQKEVTAAFDRAWSTLRLANAALLAATDACTAPNPASIYADFAAAWEALKVLIPLLGDDKPGGVKPSFTFADPIVVQLVKKARSNLP